MTSCRDHRWDKHRRLTHLAWCGSSAQCSAGENFARQRPPTASRWKFPSDRRVQRQRHPHAGQSRQPRTCRCRLSPKPNDGSRSVPSARSRYLGSFDRTVTLRVVPLKRVFFRSLLSFRDRYRTLDKHTSTKHFSIEHNGHVSEYHARTNHMSSKHAGLIQIESISHYYASNTHQQPIEPKGNRSTCMFSVIDWSRKTRRRWVSSTRKSSRDDGQALRRRRRAYVLSWSRSFSKEHIRVGKSLSQDCSIRKRTKAAFDYCQLSKSVDSCEGIKNMQDCLGIDCQIIQMRHQGAETSQAAVIFDLHLR